MRSKLIRGYNGFYKVRTDGTVWTCRARGGRGTSTRKGPWMKLKPIIQKKGKHQSVILIRKGVRKSCLIHRLVLEAFVGPCPPGMRTRHYPDQNPANNRLDNLSWATNTVNMRDKIENGTVSNGENNGQSKLTKRKVLQIRRDHTNGNYTQKELAKRYGVCRSAISFVVNRVTWRHV